MSMASVCVFCASSFGAAPGHTQLARALGAAIGRAGARLVYGGGRVGLMGEVSDAARAHGADVFGVIPRFLERAEITDTRSPVEVVDTLHDRKRRMNEESDGFVVLPGGVGTLEEAVEILSWRRLDLHAKPLVFLDNDGFWDPFFALLDRQIASGFAPADLRHGAQRAHTAEAAVTVAIAPPPEAGGKNGT